MPQNLTEKEEKLIDAFILLPITQKTLVWDKKAVQASGVKFKGPYIQAIDAMLASLSHDLYEVKREASKQYIKFYKRNLLEYIVFVHGWRHERRYHPSIAADWVQKRISRYFFQRP